MLRRLVPVVALSAVLGAGLAACGGSAARAAAAPERATARLAAKATVTRRLEYVDGHFVPFVADHPLSSADWAVVDAYARFSTAALEVYHDRSVLPLADVVAPTSKVTGMFQRYLAEGKNPEALYAKAEVLSVTITRCRAELVLDLTYPGGRSLHYVSSWVRPFVRSAAATTSTASTTGQRKAPPPAQWAPWLFVGDNRVGGASAPCGI